MNTPTNPVYHWHHIIPVHAGGTDDPSNLVLLTIQEHAEAHRLLWERHGRPQDKLAWLLLSGKTNEAEALRIAMSSEVQKHRWSQPGAREAQSERMRGNTLMSGCVRKPHTEETKQRISETQKRRYESSPHPMVGRTHSEETKRKISEKKRGTTISEDHKQKIRQANTGRKQTDHQKQRATEANAAMWDVVTPDGQKLTITNLHAFCREHHLCSGNLGRYGHTKGYRATKRVV